MNEQLVVKNFGPIKDATVDFKRVTVFIGPTGGGKSTLAKLAAVFRDKDLFIAETSKEQHSILNRGLYNYEIQNYARPGSAFYWQVSEAGLFDKLEATEDTIKINTNLAPQLGNKEEYVTQKLQSFIEGSKFDDENKLEAAVIYHFTQQFSSEFDRLTLKWYSRRFPKTLYIPAERLIASAASTSIMRVGLESPFLGRPIMNFLEAFSAARTHIVKFPIKFLDVVFEADGGDSRISNATTSLSLRESASGIQSVVPMLSVILEKLNWNSLALNRDTFAFIIEEPELNLYPTAQQGLLNWLVEKCTKGENDLTITTHSPYILSHLNLLLYAHQVAEQHPERRAEVAVIVPEASWIDPKEFACYQVEGGGVESLVNDELGLIDNNELDGLSGDAADAFDNLIRLSKGIAVK